MRIILELYLLDYEAGRAASGVDGPGIPRRTARSAQAPSRRVGSAGPGKEPQTWKRRRGAGGGAPLGKRLVASHCQRRPG